MTWTDHPNFFISRDLPSIKIKIKFHYISQNLSQFSIHATIDRNMDIVFIGPLISKFYEKIIRIFSKFEGTGSHVLKNQQS